MSRFRLLTIGVAVAISGNGTEAIVGSGLGIASGGVVGSGVGETLTTCGNSACS